MALPVAVTLDRVGYGLGPLDLSGLIAEDSLTWSSVVPGGFASCSFQLDGDFRQLTKQIPYLSILRIVGDSGRVLFEGQIEDKQPTLSAEQVGLRSGAFGLQNKLKEQTVRQIWSKRDMQWQPCLSPNGTAFSGTSTPNSNLQATIGQYDPTDLTKSGLQISSQGGISIPAGHGQYVDWQVPAGVSLAQFLCSFTLSGTDSGSSKWQAQVFQLVGSTWTAIATSTISGSSTFSPTVTSTASLIRIGCAQNSGAPVVLAANDLAQFSSIRILGTSLAEDVAGGFYGGSLIRSLLGFGSGIDAGVIEPGSDFTIDHLDASVRRSMADVLAEIASYYAREWAVWENGLLDWKTPNLQQPQWLIPISQLSALNLDASVVNSFVAAVVLYTDAASGVDAEAVLSATDRRNPYVLTQYPFGNTRLVTVGTMTPSTSAQLVRIILQDLGFGPVPAAGSIALPGETLVQHAQGNAAKAWEIRAGDNVTIPELPMADVFTQDGRGEALFHVVSAEGSSSTGNVTLSLDSYGSKRSDVLLARLAAVTRALGG